MYRSLLVARAAKLFPKERAQSFWYEAVYSGLHWRGRLNLDEDSRLAFMYEVATLDAFSSKIEWFPRWNASNGEFYVTIEEIKRQNASNAARAAAAADAAAAAKASA